MSIDEMASFQTADVFDIASIESSDFNITTSFIDLADSNNCFDVFLISNIYSSLSLTGTTLNNEKEAL